MTDQERAELKRLVERYAEACIAHHEAEDFGQYDAGAPLHRQRQRRLETGDRENDAQRAVYEWIDSH